MSFRISGLSPEPFRHLYGLSDDELAARGVERHRVTSKPGYPDRVGVRDIELGETALLLNFTHQPADTPYRASHAIFVREGAEDPYEAFDTVPEALRIRHLSLRGFDTRHAIVNADIVEGEMAHAAIERLLADPAVAYIHVHFAKQGCYAARVDRA
jgi:hypothetical protein